VWSANIAFRRSAFEQAGGFDPGLGAKANRTFRGEDSDLVRRVALAGGRVIHQPRAVVSHAIGPSRMRVGYFRRLRFYEGMSRPSAAVPRWLVGSCARHGLNAVRGYATGRPGAGLNEELIFWMELGRIVGGLR
jgi:cellulose synthase/poly-beta-1,6-N-acetylglucosamine synthase-like glycosyltransferase